MTAMTFFLLGVPPMAVANIVMGYRWSRLDHNPWAGRFLGGSLSGPTPRWNPSDMSVDEINQRGRRLMIASPITATLFLVVVFVTQTHF